MTRRGAVAAAAVTAGVCLLLAGCSEDSGSAGDSDGTVVVGGSDDSGQEPGDSGLPTPRVAGTIAEGFTSPWGLAFLPDGTALVSERDTGLVKHIDDRGRVGVVGEVPGVDFSSEEGGLLGLAVGPPGSDRPYVYAYLSTDTDNRVVRMPYRSGTLGPPQVVLSGIPVSAFHNGGRVAFGPDGMLYVSTGDATEEANAVDPDSLGGKILRVTPTGDPAPGNPTAGSPVWSLGHRNVQGLAWTGRGSLWASEFGQDTWDELNLIEPGEDYGWPAHEGLADAAGVTDPKVQWRPDDASPSGVAYAEGAVWVAALAGERLWGVPVSDDEVTGEAEAFLAGSLGRLRTVVTAPDGSLWLMTSNTDGRGEPRSGDDRILRLTLR